ncbi:sperm-associated antigen 4 protein-like [Zerene cesonia]|uniref:sperm-associated antigen 4 protein-like n=1 Tax=Zerene cesonia TaxID=33412 RepID=UPI0018E545C2|nr:sperm-associated antigen 4 protein-like [Zerene cesonia]
MTKNAFRNTCESLSAGSDAEKSTTNIVPPWCSSGRVYERRNPRKVSTRELKSSYPLRENIWEYLRDRSHCKRKFKKCSKVPPEVKQKPVAVDEECCYRMRYLTTLISRSDYALRNTLRIRRTLFTSQSYGTVANNRNAIGSYVAGASVVKGSDTSEWGSRVALWGLVPLWRAAPPPDTILALRKPTPADCWPFSGSYGNIEIHLPRLTQVARVSVEHIRPDTARSAPKDFVIYGILENGTWIKAADGIYRYNKPAKQYYSLDNRNAPLKRIVFRVLSNHGNPKYTCVYRVHLYSNDCMIYN